MAIVVSTHSLSTWHVSKDLKHRSDKYIVLEKCVDKHNHTQMHNHLVVTLKWHVQQSKFASGAIVIEREPLSTVNDNNLAACCVDQTKPF